MRSSAVTWIDYDYGRNLHIDQVNRSVCSLDLNPDSCLIETYRGDVYPDRGEAVIGNCGFCHCVFSLPSLDFESVCAINTRGLEGVPVSRYGTVFPFPTKDWRKVRAVRIKVRNEQWLKSPRDLLALQCLPDPHFQLAMSNSIGMRVFLDKGSQWFALIWLFRSVDFIPFLVFHLRRQLHYLHGQEDFSPAPIQLARVCAKAPHGPRRARAGERGVKHDGH